MAVICMGGRKRNTRYKEMGQLGWQKTRKTMDHEKMIMNEVKSAYVEEEVDV
jgi:hypothetical protein